MPLVLSCFNAFSCGKRGGFVSCLSWFQLGAWMLLKKYTKNGLFKVSNVGEENK